MGTIDLRLRAGRSIWLVGARASIRDNPQDDLYRLSVERVIAWSYGTVATWTEWRFLVSSGVDSGT